MGHNLEAPCTSTAIDWAVLYCARGSEVSEFRPVLTGDVFCNVEADSLDGQVKKRNLVVLQHPCAMRTDGVNLAKKLLVAEVKRHSVISPEDWVRYGKLLPFPDLRPEITSGQKDQAAMFDNLYLVETERLKDRIACLLPLGVNLLLQRWVHHNSRVVVPTITFNLQTSAVYEEADLLEEWCDERVAAGADIQDATHDFADWIRDESNGATRQLRLEDPQTRSTVRREMRAALISARTGSGDGS